MASPISLTLHYNVWIQALENEIEEKRPNLEESLFAGKEHLANAGDKANSVLAHQVQSLENKWKSLQTKAEDRKVRFKDFSVHSTSRKMKVMPCL